ncbi:hypothetical protein JYP52_21560 [Nitratireductor aquibiodomus]|uniref:hypothetical protein n=1 Tax=Nitratireductor TaxID=245876 RepID=UPI000DE1630A|nr:MULTISPECIES: hypothetical protein [Nitratireductor]MBN7763730.1 hypothetical protein [Nitratireductor aquibiodomus]
MSFFQQLEGEAAVVIENGVYKQVDLYARHGRLYAKVAGGFVKLMADGSTTKARMRLETLSFDGDLYRDKMGRLMAGPGDGAIKIDTDRALRLLGSSQ